jgi:hypothetical protein
LTTRYTSAVCVRRRPFPLDRIKYRIDIPYATFDARRPHRREFTEALISPADSAPLVRIDARERATTLVGAFIRASFDSPRTGASYLV